MVRQYKCETCGKIFLHLFKLLKHERIKHEDRLFNLKYIRKSNKFQCVFCDFNVKNFNSFEKHLLSCKRHCEKFQCNICDKLFKSRSVIIKHCIKCANQFGYGSGKRRLKLNTNSRFKLSKFGFRALLQQYELFSDKEFKDINSFLNYYKEDINDLIQKAINKLTSIKVQFCLAVSFSREVEDTKTYSLGYFCSRNYIFNDYEKFWRIFSKLNEFFDEKIQDFTSRGSGYVINTIDRLDVRIAVYNPLFGGCYIELPTELKNKRCIINIKNKDNKCFLWSVIASLYPIKIHAERIILYKKYEKNFNLKGIKFPMEINKIKKFEKNYSNLDFRINVYTWKVHQFKQSMLVPIRISKIKAKKLVNLLLLNEHYFLIKHFNRLVGSFSSRYHKFCSSCLSGFQTDSRLLKHEERCLNFKPSTAILPKENENKLYFRQVEQMMKFPFIMFADFESILEKNNENITDKTTIIQTHKPCAYSLIVVKDDDTIYHHNSYIGDNCIEVFLRDIKYISLEIQEYLNNYRSMSPLTEDEKIFHMNATECYLCEEKFSEEENSEGWLDIKIFDHCHLTGKYRGPAHNSCNLRYQLPQKIPLIFHNLKGYDSHFIIQHLSKKIFSKCQIIPQSSESFISFTLDDIVFLDSYQFLSESLDKLTQNLKNSNHDFPITKKIFKDYTKNDNRKIEILFKKGVFPYEYIDSFEKLKFNKLPKKSEFFSKLTQTDVPEEQYLHAMKTWKLFDMKNISEYMYFYVNLDTSLLSDIFQAFRKTILNTYKLDPCHFYSIPGLAWSAALKTTKVKLELFTDIEM